MPRTMRTRSDTVAWNSSSRGNVSSACTSALWSWLEGFRPKWSTTRCTLWRSTGISPGLPLYAEEVHRPMKRRSPVTLPFASNVLTPT